MTVDCILFSLTSKGLNYEQQLCEFQYAYKVAVVYNINIIDFITSYTICNEINRIHLERLYITKNYILTISLVYLTSSPRLYPNMHYTSNSMIFTLGLTTPALSILRYGYSAQNYLYMIV